MTETSLGVERYRQQILAWRQWRDDRLREADGWLTLAGLFWLEEGENPFGTGAENPVQLPAGSGPTRMGRFVRTGDDVRVEVEPGVAVLHDGAAVADMALSSDSEGAPTVLRLGSLSLHLIARSGRVAVRVRDRESRALKRFADLNWYPVDPTWRREARFQPFSAPRTVPVPNFIGDPLDRESPGFVTFDVDGEPHRLDAFTGKQGELFIVFGDSTNGHDRYAGGRFLYTEPPSAAGRLHLDFNKAYNPPVSSRPMPRARCRPPTTAFPSPSTRARRCTPLKPVDRHVLSQSEQAT